MMSNPFNINETEINIFEGTKVHLTCSHEKSGIKVCISKERDRASLLDMRAEALNEIEYLVVNSPRYTRILKDAQNHSKGDS